jgi:hypothetical protein
MVNTVRHLGMALVDWLFSMSKGYVAKPIPGFCAAASKNGNGSKGLKGRLGRMWGTLAKYNYVSAILR